MALFLVATLGLVVSWVLFFKFRGPLWIISPLINMVSVYAFFTILHEASHKNIFRNQGSWGNDILGTFAGLTMHGAFEHFIGVHLKHHVSVNHPTEDPDFHGRGPISLKRFVIWMFTLPHYLVQFRRLKLARGRNTAMLVAPYLLVLGIYLSAYAGGWIYELLALYTLPAFLGVGFVVIAFDYLPHHPHSDQSRYGNSVTFDEPRFNWLFFGHSFHLVHHLWPSIPWYRYGSTYRSARPQLLQAGARETSLTAQLRR